MSFERTDCNGKTYRMGDEVRCTCAESGKLRIENIDLRKKLVDAEHELGLRHSRIADLTETVADLRRQLHEQPKH